MQQVEHVTFSGRRAIEQGQSILYVTERCVLELRPEGLVVTEIAPGVDLQRDILDQAAFPMAVAGDLRTMPDALFHPPKFGLTLREAAHV